MSLKNESGRHWLMGEPDPAETAPAPGLDLPPEFDVYINNRGDQSPDEDEGCAPVPAPSLPDSREEFAPISATRMWLDTFGETAKGQVSWEFACSFAERFAEASREPLQGALNSQDGREKAAGERCGVSYEEHGCDWPDAVAERVVTLRARVERLEQALKDKP